MTRSRLFVLLFAALLIALPIAAQETTGGIEGVIKDNSGAVLPGVTVEATGAGLGVVSTTTDASGNFRFPRLRPGTYTVRATLEGFRTAEKTNVLVTLGNMTAVNLTMGLSAVAETITVTAETPLVDVTKSATATSITREQLDMIPSGRDFSDVVSQAAGASDEAFLGGISIDGASGAENRFVIDGIDTTNPQDGTSAQNVVTDFLEEVQVKSAGYAAEYGGSLGGVINVVTRSGTNDFHGTVNGYMQDRAWGGSERKTYYPSDPTLYRQFDEDDDVRTEAGFTLGGPILRDTVWFYVGYQPQWRS
ncbi:MAG TPA: carboxypeptidase regulatory-like domain-containing protein, partial [Thermoanaerobaculia bacterium]